ncbi:hypothetical protein ColKHC_01275 [Colletotrichum higginsianum]|nr:hypothetical protein ColKHC_01275 [Colletotrichum higginsianum]
MATASAPDNLTGKRKKNHLKYKQGANLHHVAVFEANCKAAWNVYFSGKHKDAEGLAAKLLGEPQLGPAHQASMHLMLAKSSNDSLLHAREAVRLYNEILADYNETSTPHQQASMRRAVRLARDALQDALKNQDKINSEVKELLQKSSIDSS